MCGQYNGGMMHREAFEFCEKAANKIGRSASFDGMQIIDVGGRNVNGSVHQLFSGAIFTTTDIMEDDGVDFVVDFSSVGIVDLLDIESKFDVAISTEVLEHSPNWPNIVKNIVDCTKPRGWIIITCATDGRPPHSAIDGHYLTDMDNEYYCNVSQNDFLNVIERYKIDVDLIYTNTTTTHCDLQILMRKSERE